jgi:hypothetical protein
MYTFIVDRATPGDADEEQLMGCRRTLAVLALQAGRHSIRTLTILIDLGRSFDVLHFFRRISSIAVSNFDVVDEETVPQPHKTFVEWIFFRHSPSGNHFQIDIVLHLANRCIDIMNSELHFNMTDIHSSAPHVRDPTGSQVPTPRQAIPEHIRYACRYGFFHFSQHPTNSDADNVLSSFICQYARKLEFFLQNTLLYWLEVAHVTSELDVHNLFQDSLIRRESTPELQSLLTEVQTFIERFGSGFSENPAHIYISALPFLPPDSLISSYYRATTHVY